MKKLHMIGATCASMILAACGGSDGPDNRDQASQDATANAPKMVRGSYAFDGKTLESVVVEDREGWAVWQGDIILGRTEDVVAGLLRNAADDQDRRHPLGITIPNRTWAAGIVTYDNRQLATGQRPMLLTAMKSIGANSPVRFSRDIEKYASYTNRPDGIRYDHVLFLNTSDPWIGGQSAVGRTGAGEQRLLLNYNLSGVYGTSVTAHELLHALGAWHEHSRADRDTYITVYPANIIPDQRYNFDIHSSDGIMNGGYDYCSVMHYNRYAFKDPDATGSTITPKQPVSCPINVIDGSGTVTVLDIGQRYGLSSGDIAMLKARYASAPSNRPTADAGADFAVAGNGARTAQLNGSASFAVPGLSIVKYQWEPAECLNIDDCYSTIVNATSARASVDLELWGAETNYTRKFRLTVTDNQGRTMSDVVTVSRTH